jgi:hypothetical protein
MSEYAGKWYQALVCLSRQWEHRPTPIKTASTSYRRVLNPPQADAPLHTPFFITLLAI